MRGAVCFVGAGPGAGDLITLRGASRIGGADLVLYAPSVADVAWLREHVRSDAELVDFARLSADELLELYRKLAASQRQAVRLVPGDPALCADLREQRELCAKLGLDVEVVPGVSPVSAAAAATGNALIETGGAASVVFTGAESDFDRVRDLVAADRTVAVQAPAARAAELAEALAAAGMAEDVPVTVAYKVSWPDETLVRTTVGELAVAVKRHNLWRHALFLVGDALREAKPRPGYLPSPADGHVPAPRWVRRSTRSGPGWAARKAESDAGEIPVQEPRSADAAEAEPEARPAVKASGARSAATKPGTKSAAKKPARTPRASARRTSR
ncbi:cobalt-precorrin-4/precorrin-4 C(11)-methyltransferase [Actinokineospora sp.]|uniref:cobalt-precorrin-4/precorrin-4 C(11)-methyltransferase n=1 Tax=Actinokineospora sp. TaxID=1872133 RepID=UPI004037F3E2